MKGTKSDTVQLNELGSNFTNEKMSSHSKNKSKSNAKVNFNHMNPHKFKLDLNKINLEHENPRESPKAEHENEYLMRTYQANSDKTRSGKTNQFSSGKMEIPIDDVTYDDNDIENLVEYDNVQNELNNEYFEQLRCNLNSARLSFRKGKEEESGSPERRVDFNKRHDFSSARKKNQHFIYQNYLDKNDQSSSKRNKLSPKKKSSSNNYIEKQFNNSENKIMNQIRMEAKHKMDEERHMKNKAIAESTDLRYEIERVRKENAHLKKHNAHLTENVKHLETSLSKVESLNNTSGAGSVFKSKEMALNKKALNLQYKIRHLKFKEQM